MENKEELRILLPEDFETYRTQVKKVLDVLPGEPHDALIVLMYAKEFVEDKWDVINQISKKELGNGIKG